MFKHGMLFLVLFLTCYYIKVYFTLTSEEPNFSITAKDVVQLPRSMHPKVYQINLVINLETRNVYGRQIIHLRCLADTKAFCLHFSEINIEEIQIFNASRGTEDVYFMTDQESELIVIENRNLFKSQQWYYLYIIFNKEKISAANDQNTSSMSGFYTFNDSNSAIGVSAITQFEAAFARKLFPCFDDPFFRSKFKFTIIHTNHLKALCVAPTINVTRFNTSYETTQFKYSVNLPTYLVALALVPKLSKKFNVENLKIEVWRGDDAIFPTLQLITNFTVTKLVKMLNMSAPIDEMHIVFCPLANIGMENFGLITINSDVLSGENANLDLVLIHEIVHHWWGNIVSHAWWSDVWINEGFTYYIADIIQEEYYNGLKPNLTANRTKEVFNNYREGFFFPKPISNRIQKGTSRYVMENAFEGISRMHYVAKYFHYLVGINFFPCLANFIKKHYLKSVTSDQFINFLGNCSSDEDNRKLVIQSMHEWINISENPIFIVKKHTSQKLIALRKYYVPNTAPFLTTKLSLSYENGTSFKDVWLTGPNQTIAYNQDETYIVNYYRRTFAQIWYDDDDDWLEIIDKLSTSRAKGSSFAYFGLLHDLNHAITRKHAPVYAIFKVLENINLAKSHFLPLQRIYEALIYRLSDFFYSDDFRTLSEKTLTEFQNMPIFQNCTRNFLQPYSVQQLCDFAGYFCTPTNLQFCHKKNITEFYDRQFVLFIEKNQISDEAELYVRHSDVIFKDLTKFNEFTRLLIIEECLIYHWCRYRFLREFSKREGIRELWLDIATAHCNFDFEFCGISVGEPSDSYSFMDYIDFGFEKLKNYYSL